MNEISQDLKDKLKVIELETGFFAHKPQKPRNIHYIFWSFVVLLLLASFLLDRETHLSTFMLLAFSGFHLLNYFHEKRLHELYSNACEIIGYYKKHEGRKI